VKEKDASRYCDNGTGSLDNILRMGLTKVPRVASSVAVDMHDVDASRVSEFKPIVTGSFPRPRRINASLLSSTAD